jgi:hypothetical protein
MLKRAARVSSCHCRSHTEGLPLLWTLVRCVAIPDSLPCQRDEGLRTQAQPALRSGERRSDRELRCLRPPTSPGHGTQERLSMNSPACDVGFRMVGWLPVRSCRVRSLTCRIIPPALAPQNCATAQRNYSICAQSVKLSAAAHAPTRVLCWTRNHAATVCRWPLRIRRLQRQTPMPMPSTSLATTLGTAIAMDRDCLAVFGYAHILQRILQELSGAPGATA